MKAKDYYNKYRPLVYEAPDGIPQELQNGRVVHLPKTEGELFDITNSVFKEFVSDYRKIIDQRKIKTPRALKSIIEEVNTKWNAFVGFFEQEYGASPFHRNGFRAVILKHMSEDPALLPMYDYLTKKGDTN